MLWKLLETDQLIDLNETLNSGQIFNFRLTGHEEYTGELQSFIFCLKKVGGEIFYSILSFDNSKINELLKILKRRAKGFLKHNGSMDLKRSIENVSLKIYNLSQEDGFFDKPGFFNKIECTSLLKQEDIVQTKQNVSDVYMFSKDDVYLKRKYTVFHDSIDDTILLKTEKRSILPPFSNRKFYNFYHKLIDTVGLDGWIFDLFCYLLDGLVEEILQRFLTLDINYNKILKTWNITRCSGLRLVRNSIIPTIFSFICSSNNNVKRITKMVNFLYSKGSLAVRYKNMNFYYFPELDKISNIENELKVAGFGYRARYIVKTATLLSRNKYIKFSAYDSYFDNFTDYKRIKKELLCLFGVGPKVDDCICLMGFGMLHVVPIDTHILKYARLEMGINDKNLNCAVYEKIQKKFIEIYGDMAGIAQLYIFKSRLDGTKRTM